METNKKSQVAEIKYVKPEILDLGRLSAAYGANCYPGSNATGFGGDCEAGSYANSCLANGSNASPAY